MQSGSDYPALSLTVFCQQVVSEMQTIVSAQTSKCDWCVFIARRYQPTDPLRAAIQIPRQSAGDMFSFRNFWGMNRGQSQDVWEPIRSHLFNIFLESSPKTARQRRQALETIIAEALGGVQKRMTQYAEYMAAHADTAPIQEMEKSVAIYFDEKFGLLNASREIDMPTVELSDAPREEARDLHVRALAQCETVLETDLRLLDTPTLDRLRAWDVLSEASLTSLLETPKQRARNRALVQLARGLTLEDFRDKFLPALREEGGNALLAARLESKMEELREAGASESEGGCLPCRLRERVDLPRFAAQLRRRNLIPASLVEDVRKGALTTRGAWGMIFGEVRNSQKLLPVLQEKYPAVRDAMMEAQLTTLECRCLLTICLPETLGQSHVADKNSDVARMSDFTSTTQKTLVQIPEYSMESTTRGVCLVVENSLFEESSGRKVAAKRYKNCTSALQQEFQTLGLEVERQSNLSAKQLLEEAQRLADLDHSQHDCFVCLIASVSDDSDRIKCSDGGTVSVQELMSVFTSSRCPSLAGKPKLFYMVRRRGWSKQGGLQTSERAEAHPDHADFLLMESSMPDCKAYFDQASGLALHLKKLTGVLQGHAHTLDFLTCLAMANSELAAASLPDSGSYHVSPVTSTLRKSLVFRKLP